MNTAAVDRFVRSHDRSRACGRACGRARERAGMHASVQTCVAATAAKKRRKRCENNAKRCENYSKRCENGRQRPKNRIFWMFAKVSIDSIDSIFFGVLGHAGVKRNVGEVEICVLSKFQPFATLGGRKNAETSKRNKLDFFVNFDSIDSIVGSIQSIMR